MSDFIDLEIKVIPNKKKNRIILNKPDFSLKIEIKAKPIEGKANWELINFLSKTLDIRKDQIAIIRGDHSRQKVVRLQQINRNEVLRRIKIESQLP